MMKAASFGQRARIMSATCGSAVRAAASSGCWNAWRSAAATMVCKIVVADGDAEVLGDLAAAEHGTDRLADGGSAGERLASAANAGLDALELPLGVGEQFASLARAFLGQRRVAADDEALARIVRAFDLGQIALVEQRQLQRGRR